MLAGVKGSASQVNAGGVAQASPARKRWEKFRRETKRRRCGTLKFSSMPELTRRARRTVEREARQKKEAHGKLTRASLQINQIFVYLRDHLLIDTACRFRIINPPPPIPSSPRS
jgi:hypothetical protein